MPELEVQDPHAAFRAVKQFESLDGFRAASILAVLFHHAAEPVSWLPATYRGFLGVDMFFLLSGFLIVTLLLRERDGYGRISLRQFYMRRTLRIFPVYYGLVLLFAVLFLTVGKNLNTAQGFFAALPFYLTYTSNWTTTQAGFFFIFWSLAAEEQFYLIWPAIEKYLKERAVLVVLAAAVGINQLINFGMLDGLLQSQFGIARHNLVMLQITFTPILLGVALAHALHHRRTFDALYGLLKGRYSPLVLLAWVFVLCNIAPEDISGWPRLTIQLSLLLLLASCVIRQDHVLRRVLNWRPLARIGTISYGMYVYHLWVLHFANMLNDRLPLKIPGAPFVLCLLGTVIAAELSYRYYELPFLSLKKRFGRKREIRQPQQLLEH